MKPPAYALLERVIDPNHAGARYSWPELRDALETVRDDHDDDPAGSEALMRRILEFAGEVELEDGERPHAMPPEDVMRSLAIQALAAWAPARFQPDIERVRDDPASSDAVAAIARSVLRS